MKLMDDIVQSLVRIMTIGKQEVISWSLVKKCGVCSFSKQWPSTSNGLRYESHFFWRRARRLTS